MTATKTIDLLAIAERLDRFAGYLEAGWVAHAGMPGEKLEPADLREAVAALRAMEASNGQS